MQNKYGKVNIKLPVTYAQEKEAILKAVKEGTTTVEEGRKMVLKIQREANLFIVITNGGYTMPTRKKRAAARKMKRVQKYLDQAEKMLAEQEKAPEGETIADPKPPVKEPEPIDTPSRTPVTPDLSTPAPEPIEPPSSLIDHLQPLIDEKLGRTKDAVILDEVASYGS